MNLRQERKVRNRSSKGYGVDYYENDNEVDMEIESSEDLIDIETRRESVGGGRQMKDELDYCEVEEQHQSVERRKEQWKSDLKRSVEAEYFIFDDFDEDKVNHMKMQNEELTGYHKKMHGESGDLHSPLKEKYTPLASPIDTHTFSSSTSSRVIFPGQSNQHMDIETKRRIEETLKFNNEVDKNSEDVKYMKEKEGDDSQFFDTSTSPSNSQEFLSTSLSRSTLLINKKNVSNLKKVSAINEEMGIASQSFYSTGTRMKFLDGFQSSLKEGQEKEEGHINLTKSKEVMVENEELNLEEDEENHLINCMLQSINVSEEDGVEEQNFKRQHQGRRRSKEKSIEIMEAVSNSFPISDVDEVTRSLMLDLPDEKRRTFLSEFECSICCEYMVKVTALGCPLRHLFCHECIYKWLKRQVETAVDGDSTNTSSTQTARKIDCQIVCPICQLDVGVNTQNVLEKVRNPINEMMKSKNPLSKLLLSMNAYFQPSHEGTNPDANMPHSVDRQRHGGNNMLLRGSLLEGNHENHEKHENDTNQVDYIDQEIRKVLYPIPQMDFIIERHVRASMLYDEMVSYFRRQRNIRKFSLTEERNNEYYEKKEIQANQLRRRRQGRSVYQNLSDDRERDPEPINENETNIIRTIGSELKELLTETKNSAFELVTSLTQNPLRFFDEEWNRSNVEDDESSAMRREESQGQSSHQEENNNHSEYYGQDSEIVSQEEPGLGLGLATALSVAGVFVTLVVLRHVRAR